MFRKNLRWSSKCLKFGALWVRTRIGQRHQNVLVRVHVRLTPTISTPNILSDIGLEQVGLWQRRGALRLHSQEERLRVLGEEIVRGADTADDSADTTDTFDTDARQRTTERPAERAATTHA